MLQALRIRDFRLLWAGGLISSLGSWLLTLAIPTHIFLVTGSLRATGLTVAAEYLPLLILGPVAGVFADRWDRRRLMIGTNLFCAGAVAVMLLGTAPGRYWVLYAALIAENAGVVLYAPAWQARTPAIVGTGSAAEQRQRAELGQQRHGQADRRPARRDPAGRLGRPLADRDRRRQLPAVRRGHVHDQRGRPRTAGRSRRDHHRRPGRPRPAPHGAPRPAPPARRPGAAAGHGHLPGRQRLAQRGAHPVRHPAARRQRAHRLPAGRPGRGLPARRPGHPPAAGPGPARAPAGRDPRRHRRRVLRAVHLVVAAHRAARGGRRRHVRLHVAGDPADRHAAGDPERGPRPDRRGLPHRRGGRHPGRRRGRPRPGPGGRPHRHRRRRQPGHPGRGRARPAQCSSARFRQPGPVSTNQPPAQQVRTCQPPG